MKRHEDGVQVGCLVPMLRAMVTGGIVFLIALGVGIWRGWEDYPAIALMAGALAALVSWLDDGRGWRRLAYGDPSEGRDYEFENGALRQRTPVSAPYGYGERMRLEISSNEGRRMQFVEIGDGRAWRRLCEGLARGEPMTVRYWGPRIGEAAYSEMVGQMVQRGWAQYRRSDPQGGTELTAEGREVVEAAAKAPHPGAQLGGFGERGA